MTAIADPQASAASTIADVASGGMVDGRYRLINATEHDSPLRWTAFDQRLNRHVEVTFVVADGDARSLQSILADTPSSVQLLDAGEIDLGGARRIYLVSAGAAEPAPAAETVTPSVTWGPAHYVERRDADQPEHVARVGSRLGAAVRVRFSTPARLAS